MMNYVDSCLTYEILLQDSGLLPKPRPTWNTFVPKKGDIAYVDEEDCYYRFGGKRWVKVQKEEGDDGQ